MPSLTESPLYDTEEEDNEMQESVEYHPAVNGKPCDSEGNILQDGTPPPLFIYGPPDDFMPFEDCASFELADLLYRRNQMPANMDSSPFVNSNDLYSSIDAITIGSVPWQSFSVSYQSEIETESPPSWKTTEYKVFFRDPCEVLKTQLANPNFANEMDFSPKHVTDWQGKHHYQDFMSGNWAWQQADRILDELGLSDITYCPVIVGSNKTTVSVAMGQNEYYPLYASNGLIHNNVHHAHCNGVSLLGFLSVPKMDREHQDSPEFQTFHCQIFHGSLCAKFESLRPGMETPEVLCYGDGHYCQTIYGLGPYIANYPEQALLACIVQGWCPRCTASHHNLDGPGGRRTHEHTATCARAMSSKEMWDDYGIIDGIMPFTSGFPRADIHELLSPDLLHQIIKGTFKDHLVTWIEDYIKTANTPQEATQILADIDRHIAAVPPFPGLQRFPEGRGFKQWTGDNSKALMKVYLPAIAGHVPPPMVRALAAFMEFCYCVRRSVIDEENLIKIDTSVANFHHEREIFHEVRSDGKRTDAFSLPRQHALSHFRHLIQDPAFHNTIQEFGAPNGLCSSITESKHIKVVKEPWRHSSRFEALAQMLLINERLDKLAAVRVDFQVRGMLDGSIFGISHVEASTPDSINENDDGGAVESPGILAEVKLARTPVLASKAPRNIHLLAQRLSLPRLPELVQRFLYEQLSINPQVAPEDVDLDQCPQYHGKITVYPSAISTYYAPSDLSGIGGLYRERIRAMTSWRKGSSCYDCVFCEAEEDGEGFQALHVACVRLFFSLRHHGIYYPCALVTWFSPVGDVPCPDTGMWVVRPDIDAAGERIMSVIHLDCIVRAAHLIGVAGEEFIPKRLKHSDSLDVIPSFFVNKYADHHAHEIAF
ncbi:hypothetical protein ARMGADRAFT_1055759 [Armillaria gallica]|uniref:CxC2-like cysteine cluster KDZ transposase-associated domain-containing protein n=1 Tax=Armillaria gallica TaxID=47427 RepID=A0A2H3D2W2_ARMGA|nr:hypothetical protein ARMGADRAFT_1055759 [Armillaria gallica]